MSEHMGAVVEVWPVAADATGIWLLSGADAWRSERVPADDEPHSMLDFTLWDNGARYTKFVHSTSWRVDGPHIVLTYVAVVETEPPIKEDWPDALPISTELAETVGPAEAGEALQPPAPVTSTSCCTESVTYASCSTRTPLLGRVSRTRGHGIWTTYSPR